MKRIQPEPAMKIVLDEHGHPKAGVFQLLDLCRDFIRNNRITCNETIYQTDSVIQNSYELVKKMCEIVGYYQEDTDDEATVSADKG